MAVGCPLLMCLPGPSGPNSSAGQRSAAGQRSGPHFGGLVLGCIDSYDIATKYSFCRIFEHFSRSTRLSKWIFDFCNFSMPLHCNCSLFLQNFANFGISKIFVEIGRVRSDVDDFLDRTDRHDLNCHFSHTSFISFFFSRLGTGAGGVG